MGFTYGNMLKRICTIGWSVLGLCWLAYLIRSGMEIEPDKAFGDCIRHVLPPFAQGLMLSCVMAAAMSSGDAVQVTVAGLFTQSIYRQYINPRADDLLYVKVTRMIGVFVILVSFILAIMMQNDFVGSIVAYFRILSFIGIAIALGIIWRRMNSAGVFCCIIPAIAVYIFVKVNAQHHYINIAANLAAVLPLLTGLLGGIGGSLLTAAPEKKVVEKFFTKIYVPIGQEHKLELPFEQAVPPSKRLLTAGGLFIIKPTRQSWTGFLVALGICLACVFVMIWMLG
jgi:Na+/proline symporter